MRWLSSLSFDVLTYTCLSHLSSPSRPRMKSDGTHLSHWLQSLSSFCGVVCRRYAGQIEMEAIVQYVCNQLKEESSVELCVLKELLAKCVMLDQGMSLSSSASFSLSFSLSRSFSLFLSLSLSLSRFLVLSNFFCLLLFFLSLPSLSLVCVSLCGTYLGLIFLFLCTKKKKKKNKAEDASEEQLRVICGGPVLREHVPVVSRAQTGVKVPSLSPLSFLPFFFSSVVRSSSSLPLCGHHYRQCSANFCFLSSFLLPLCSSFLLTIPSFLPLALAPLSFSSLFCAQKATEKLKGVLLHNNLFLPLLVLIARAREAIVYRSPEDSPLKMIATLYDNSQEVEESGGVFSLSFFFPLTHLYPPPSSSPGSHIVDRVLTHTHTQREAEYSPSLPLLSLSYLSTQSGCCVLSVSPSSSSPLL